MSAALPVQDHEYSVNYEAGYSTCLRCGTLFQVPMPDIETLASFYPETYHSQTNHGLLMQVRNQLRWRSLRPLLVDDGALLDYGCGNGAFLQWLALRYTGRPMFGYEISSHREVVKLAGGAVTLVKGDFDYLLNLLPPCRLITMNHVIEHLPDPLGVVSALNERLLSGGTLEGQTPRCDSREHQVFRTFWSGYHAPRHTVVFSKGGLAALLRRAGFKDVAVKAGFNPAGLAVSLAARWQAEASRRIRRQGPSWFFWVGFATLLAPFDLLSGAPGMMNFVAAKK